MSAPDAHNTSSYSPVGLGFSGTRMIVEDLKKAGTWQKGVEDVCDSA